MAVSYSRRHSLDADQPGDNRQMHQPQYAVQRAVRRFGKEHLPDDAAGNSGDDPGNQRRRSEDGGAEQAALFAADDHNSHRKT